MLTIQPNLVNNYSKAPAFHGLNDEEYVDYTEIFDDSELSRQSDVFDIEQEKGEAKKELDLWKQTKQNIDSLAQTTESVPVLNKGMKVFSGLISIAIGWGGLRWGTVGTLEVMSKLGKSKLVQAMKGYSEAGYEGVSNLAKKGKRYVKGRQWYVSAGNTIEGWKQSFLNTSVGSALSKWKRAITTNSLYVKAGEMKQDSVNYVKKLNPKRVFIETMGVAGGGTAAINTLGGKSVDGVKQNVEQNENGDYLINGRVVRDNGGYTDAA